MNTSLTLSLNQLSSLIGSLAFPDPDGDDTLVHGPGGPRVRGWLADIRRVSIAVTAWAEHLVEQSVAAEQHGAPAPREKKEDPSPSKSDCPPSQDGTKPTGPPTVARIVEPAIRDFVADFVRGSAVRLPVPAGRDSNPWKLTLGPSGLLARALLVAGAQFEFAAAAIHPGWLSDLLRQAGRELLEQGIRRIDEPASHVIA